MIWYLNQQTKKLQIFFFLFNNLPPPPHLVNLSHSLNRADRRWKHSSWMFATVCAVVIYFFFAFQIVVIPLVFFIKFSRSTAQLHAQFIAQCYQHVLYALFFRSFVRRWCYFSRWSKKGEQFHFVGRAITVEPPGRTEDERTTILRMSEKEKQTGTHTTNQHIPAFSRHFNEWNVVRMFIWF